MTLRPPDSTGSRWMGVLCAVLLVVGAAVRVALLASPVGRLNADEAVVGLMADQIRSTHHVPLFYWGQYYGGTLEPLFVAGLFAVSRSVLSMRLAALALSAVGAGVVVAIGRRLFGDARAWLAGALTAAWPGTVYVSTREFGFYWAQFALVIAAIAFGLHLLAVAPRWPRRTVFLFGVFAGLAWWQSPQAAFVLLPLGAWIVAIGRPPLRAWLPALAGAVIGAGPWLVALGEYGPHRLFSGPEHGVSYLGRLRLAFTQLIPRALGLRGSYAGGWLFSWFGIAVFVAGVVAFAVVAAKAMRRPAVPIAPIVWCILMFPFVVAIPPATSRVTDPRYAILLVPLVALLLARYATRPAVATLVVLVTVSMCIANLSSITDAASDDVHGLELRPMPVTLAVRDLTTMQVRYAYADYWLASPITFASNERIVLAPVDVVRSLNLQDVVDDHHSRTWIMYRSASRDRALPRELAALHVHWTRTTVGTLAVYELDRYVDPRLLMRFWKHHRAGAR